MKKSLLLAAILLAATPGFAQSETQPADGQIVVSVTPANGTLSRTDNRTDTNWKKIWESNENNVKLEITIAESGTNYNNMQNSNGVLQIASGGKTSSYTFTHTVGNYYISNISLDVTLTNVNATGTSTFVCGGNTTTIVGPDSETHHITGDFAFGEPALFVLSGANNVFNTSNFTVTLTPSPVFNTFDQYVTIKSGSDLYMTAEGNNNVVCWGNAPGIRAVWTAHKLDNGKVTFTNAVTGKTLAATEKGVGINDNIATEWTVSANPGERVVTIANPDGQLLKSARGSFGYADDETAEADRTWTIEPISNDQRQGWHDEVINNVSNYLVEYSFGNEPGKYSVEDVTTEYFVEIAQKRATFHNSYTAGGFNFPLAYELFSVSKNPLPTIFDLNSLAGPALLTLDYPGTGWGANTKVVASNITISGIDIITVGTVADVFVWADSKLYALKNGFAIKATTSGPVAQTADDDIADNEGAIFSFCPVQPNNSIYSRYSIKYADTNYYWGGSSTGGKRLSFGAQDGTPAKGYGYNVDFVNELTVDVDGDKLYRTPVAVELTGNDDIETYVISVDGADITTTKVDASEGTVFAAGTGFIFHGSGTMTLNVHNGEAGDSRYTANIGGAHKLHAYSAGEGNVALVVAPASAAEPMLLADNGPSVKMTVIDSNDAMEAHAATIELAKHDKISVGENIDVALGALTTTGIAEISADANASGAIFDLQGRRLAAPAKGINIIGGKKVLVK